MAAKDQDIGNSLGFHLLSHMEGENSDSDQKVKGLWARTPDRQGHKVGEVAASLFMSPVASENILYHVHCWLSTNSKAILYCEPIHSNKVHPLTMGPKDIMVL